MDTVYSCLFFFCTVFQNYTYNYSESLITSIAQLHLVEEDCIQCFVPLSWRNFRSVLQLKKITLTELIHFVCLGMNNFNGFLVYVTGQI